MEEIEAKDNAAVESKSSDSQEVDFKLTNLNEAEQDDKSDGNNDNSADEKTNVDLTENPEKSEDKTKENSDTDNSNDITKTLETAGEVQKEPEQPSIETREHPKYGRKVFFLNPPLSITSYIMDNLKEEQLEVYSIYDYKVAKPVLKLYPDSICFIFVDDEMPLKGWYNFIQSFEDDDDLKSIFLGAISARIRPKDKENFLMNLKLPCGFVSLTGSVNEVYKNLSGILKINGAKGNRQYVKLDCKDNLIVTGYLAEKLRLYQFIVCNMSTAGIAIKMPLSQGYKFVKNTVIDNICVNLGKKTAVCSGLIYDVRIIDNVYNTIILFTKQTTFDQRKSIRNFIFEKLQEQFDLIQSNLCADVSSYVHDDDSKDTDNNKLDSPEGDVVLNEIEEAEEVEEAGDKEEAVNETEEIIENKEETKETPSEDTSKN